MLQAQLAKVDAFIANPPPLPVARWREAAAKEQAGKDELSRPPLSTAHVSTKNDLGQVTPSKNSTPETATNTKPAPIKTDAASTPRLVWLVTILAAIGLLWLTLKQRQ